MVVVGRLYRPGLISSVRGQAGSGGKVPKRGGWVRGPSWKVRASRRPSPWGGMLANMEDWLPTRGLIDYLDILRIIETEFLTVTVKQPWKGRTLE